jgi:cysteine desulfurase
MINMDLEGFAIATGSTCALGASDPSAALLAMGMSKKRAASTVRISFGEGNSEGDGALAADVLLSVAARLRGLARR